MNQGSVILFSVLPLCLQYGLGYGSGLGARVRSHRMEVVAVVQQLGCVAKKGLAGWQITCH